ncbi:hypothetical protein ACU4HD_42445 [Cupriavidus basilensis]
MKIRGQRTGVGVASAVRKLGLQDAGSAGAKEHTDPVRAVAGHACANLLRKAVLFQPQLRQPVVAAVELSQRRGQRRLIHLRDFTNIRIQPDIAELAGNQPAALCAQGRQCGVEAMPQATGGCVVREKKGGHCFVDPFARCADCIKWPVSASRTGHGVT